MSTKKETITEAEQAQADATAQVEESLADAKAEADITTDPGEQLVSIELFKDNEKYTDDVFVAVNGERVQIRRGETVMVKRKFVEVLEQSRKQDIATSNMIARESADFEAKAAALKL